MDRITPHLFWDVVNLSSVIKLPWLDASGLTASVPASCKLGPNVFDKHSSCLSNHRWAASCTVTTVSLNYDSIWANHRQNVLWRVLRSKFGTGVVGRPPITVNVNMTSLVLERTINSQNEQLFHFLRHWPVITSENAHRAVESVLIDAAARGALEVFQFVKRMGYTTTPTNQKTISSIFGLSCLQPIPLMLTSYTLQDALSQAKQYRRKKLAQFLCQWVEEEKQKLKK